MNGLRDFCHLNLMSTKLASSVFIFKRLNMKINLTHSTFSFMNELQVNGFTIFLGYQLLQRKVYNKKETNLITLE